MDSNIEELNFEYNVDLTDQSIPYVTAEEEHHHYDKTKVHSFDKSYESLCNDIINDESVMYYYLYPDIGFNKDYIKNSIKIWKDLGINLHDIYVAKKFRNIEKYKTVNRAFLNAFKIGNPSKLKLKFKDILQMSTKVNILEVDNEKFNGIVFNNIVLPKLEKKLVSTIYAHELTHTQLETRDGGTNSISNIEMIPIFMEYVFASVQKEPKTNLFYVQNERLKSVSNLIYEIGTNNKMPFFRRIECEGFIISSLQAIKLFDIYYHGDESLKKEILNDINRLFEGEIITEDIINKYDVYYDNVPRDIKTLKLTF